MILDGMDKLDIFHKLQSELAAFLPTLNVNSDALVPNNRLLQQELAILPEELIYSGGYVVHTLEAAVWCLLTTSNFPEAVLKAVNLGGDADTTGAVTGGLAGLLYGFEGIPADWINTLARKDDIAALVRELEKRFADR